MASLRILFVTNNYTPYSGGVVSSIQSCVHELQKEGHTILIATLQFSDHQENDPVHVVRIPCPFTFTHKKNPMAVPWRPAKYLEELIQHYKPDIIHAHHPFLLGKSALTVAQKRGVPIVFTYHTLYEHYAHYVPLPEKITRWALHQIVPTFCNAVDGIIAPSSCVKSMIEPYTKKPITVIPSPLQEPFLPKEPFLAKQHTAPFRLLLVSRMVKEKNIPFLLDLFAKLDQENYSFTLIGYGDDYQALQDYAYLTLHLSPQNVRFIYKPSKEIIREQYQHHDLFLFSSRSDTQAIVLAESMASGTPIVALDGPGQRDIITNGENGFIVDSADEMLNIVKKIATDKALHQALQYNAWQTSYRYMPPTIAQQLVAFYKRFC
jgi:1,2-diacylglycerol 3-alpha-glucosyltransferase